MSEFNLHIIDNFLPNDVYTKILNSITDIAWDPLNHVYDYKKTEKLEPKHVWFSQGIDMGGFFAKEIKNCINKSGSFTIKNFSLLSFTMATKVDPFPHRDGPVKGKYNRQMVLYIDGANDINKGTGFYVKNDNRYDLNTHIGFRKNRAVLFNAGMWHSPLLFASQDSAPRISIIAQFI